MKRLFLIFLVLLISSGIILSCSNSSQKGISNSHSTSNDISYSGAPGGSTGTESKGSTPKQETTSTNNKPRKIIQDANIDVEVNDPYTTYDVLFKKTDEYKGYISNSNKSIDGNEKRAYVEARVPAEKLLIFLKFVETLGNAKNSVISSNEITRDYYDTQASLENAILQKNQLDEIMKKAITIDDILKVQKVLDPIQERIDQLKGQISLWDNMVDLSTVRITITQNPRSVVVQSPSKWNPLTFKQWGSYIKKSFISGLNTIVIIIQWIFVIIVYPITWLILFIFVIFIIYFIRKSKKH